MPLRIVTSPRLPKADVLVLAFFAKQKPTDHPWWSGLPTDVQNAVRRWMKAKDVRMEWGASFVIRPGSGQWPAVLLMGLGERSAWNDRRERLLARRVARLALEHRWTTMTIAVQRLADESAKLLAENMAMANYEFQQFRKAPPGGWPTMKLVQLALPAKTPKLDKALHEGLVIAETVNACRDLANLPGSHMTPKLLAAEAIKLAKSAKLKVNVLEIGQMKKLKMGAILGVAQGSAERPRLIVVEYRGYHPRRDPSYPRRGGIDLAFVGKGVTFDSGGLNLKPSSGIYEMHMDMSGAAAVICAVIAIAKLKLPINVVAVAPAVENMPSGSSYRPGDLLTSMSGKVIEVTNTDAEGRVILSDGLTYAQKFYKPRMIVDVATLTGAAVVALGQRAIGMFSNRDSFETTGRELGETSGDYVWPLPLWEEYDQEVKGTFGDIVNSVKGPYGGAIQGAVFLKQFVDKKTPWVHLDIAPTMTPAEGDHLAKGASGTGVRWLVELARREAKK